MKLSLLEKGKKSIYVNDRLVSDCGRDTRGGAYFFRDLSEVTVDGEVFILNMASKDGGGIYFYNCHGITVRNCIFILNLAKWGGAVYMEECSNIRILDNVFLFNFAYRDGGAVSLSHCSKIHAMRGNRFLGNIGMRSCCNVEFHKCC